jgi:hypothetical protein
MDYWSDLSKVKKSMVLYAGSQNQKRSNGRETLNWRSLMTQDF